MARIILGSARKSENNTTIGRAGDQTGKEVAYDNFYMHRLGWMRLRPISADLAINLAKAMCQAIENPNIGYSQALVNGTEGRLGVYNLLQQNPTRQIKDINVPCNCDCSALVRACFYQTTNKHKIIPDFHTATAIKVLEDTKFFYPATQVTSEADVKVGDILCTPTKGHIVIACKAI